MRPSQGAPSRGGVTSWGTAAARAEPMQDQPDAPPSTLGTPGCRGGGLPVGTGADWPFPGASGAQAVLPGSNGLGEAQSIPSAGQPHSPGSSPGPQPQFPAAAPRDAPSAAAPMQRAQRQHPPHAAFYGPAAAAAQTWAAGTRRWEPTWGWPRAAPRAAPRGPPRAGAERQSAPCRQHPACLGAPQAPCSSASLCPVQPPSLPYAAPPSPSWTAPHPRLVLTLCRAAGVHRATSHLPVPPEPHEPCSPSCPRPAWHGWHQARARTPPGLARSSAEG